MVLGHTQIELGRAGSFEPLPLVARRKGTHMPSGTHCWKHDLWYPSLGECPRCLAEESAERQREHFERQEEARHDAAERHEETLRRDEEREQDRKREREQEQEETRDREEERQRDNERQHHELIALREREVFERNNPGDYQCPECLLISLKRGARRCPMCRAAVGPGHWPQIYENERLQAEEETRRKRLAAENWAKGEPERQLKAKALADATAKAAAERAVATSKAASAKRQASLLDGVVNAYFGYLLPILVFGTVWLVNAVIDPQRVRALGGLDAILLLIPAFNWLITLGLLLTGSNARPLAWVVLCSWASVGALIYRAARTARRA